MFNFKAFFGYAAAVLASGLLLAVPIGLPRWLTHAIGGLKLRANPTSSGGELRYRISRGDYVIDVNQPVVPQGPLAQESPFVQIRWSPLAALPPHIEDAVDLDGDGHHDLVARFDYPASGTEVLSVDVTSESSQVGSLHRVTIESRSALIARIGDGIVVRVPLVP
jgi:hypothetical protein